MDVNRLTNDSRLHTNSMWSKFCPVLVINGQNIFLEKKKINFVETAPRKDKSGNCSFWQLDCFPTQRACHSIPSPGFLLRFAIAGRCHLVNVSQGMMGGGGYRKNGNQT